MGTSGACDGPVGLEVVEPDDVDATGRCLHISSHTVAVIVFGKATWALGPMVELPATKMTLLTFTAENSTELVSDAAGLTAVALQSSGLLISWTFINCYVLFTSVLSTQFLS